MINLLSIVAKLCFFYKHFLFRNNPIKLATKDRNAQTVVLLTMFWRWSPAQRTNDPTVLGFGRHTNDWFESQPAPEDDGEVLIIQIDSKASPTATELKKRRGKANPHPGSQRHRSRAARKNRYKKKRRGR
jgi:hypothetical protein